MVKKYKYLLLGLTAAAVLTGCGSQKQTDAPAAKNSTEAAPEAADTAETLSEDMDAAENDTEAAELEKITPADYLIKNASEYVELSSYDGMEVNQYTYDITDDMVQEQIQTALEDAAVESEAETSSIGDQVYVTLKSSVQGSDAEPETEDTYFTIGEEEYGADFDAQLTGVSVGEKKSFSSSFDNDTWNDDWAGQTVDFEAEIMGITHYEIPEYNDSFVAENTDYSTTAEYEAAIRESLEQEYTEISYSDTIEELFRTAVEQTNFNGYPTELYDQCREEILSSYTSFLGDDSLDTDEVLEMFGVTDADIDAETRDAVNRRLLISAYCDANKITVSEDEYKTYVTENAAYYGADSALEFEEQYTREALVLSLYESKVADELYKSAKITETPFSEAENLTDADFESIEDAEEIPSETETEEL